MMKSVAYYNHNHRLSPIHSSINFHGHTSRYTPTQSTFLVCEKVSNSSFKFSIHSQLITTKSNTVQLSVNNGLLHPDMTVTSIYSNMTYQEPVDPEIRKCYLHGIINNAIDPNSAQEKGSAAVSVCGGLTGLIHHQNEFIFIEPVHEEFHSVKKLRAKYHRTSP